MDHTFGPKTHNNDHYHQRHHHPGVLQLHGWVRVGSPSSSLHHKSATITQMAFSSAAFHANWDISQNCAATDVPRGKTIWLNGDA